jgi:copper chaperone CopZ
MSHVILEVPDISCGHCEKTILTALQGQPGVQAVQVSIPAKTVDLTFDEQILSLPQVEALLDEEGYPVSGVREGSAPPTPKGPVIPLIGR